MNKLIAALERRFGRFAIPNVTMLLIVAQVMVFLLAQVRRELIPNIVLVPGLVLQGEVHRLLLFLAQPPSLGLGLSVIFTIFFWLLFYMMGTTLEQVWGVFRYNLFLLIGYIATVAVSFLQPESVVTNAFLQGSVFLAFAFLFPDFILRIYFILPIKIKWLALLTWILYLIQFLTGPISVKLAVLASVLNFFVFFTGEIIARVKHRHRRQKWQAREQANKDQPRHRCVICGITERDDRFMDFRYCSKCEGTQCYCRDHLTNHEHIVKAQ